MKLAIGVTVIAAVLWLIAGCVMAHAKSGWVKSADVGCNDVDDCFLIDNYTDDHRKGVQCVLFVIPVYDHPNGKIVGSLINDAGPFKKISQRGRFTRVKGDGFSNDIFDFSGCG
jgi:hypothetical protein